MSFARSFAVVTLVGVAMITACSEDEAPSVTPVAPDGAAPAPPPPPSADAGSVSPPGDAGEDASLPRYSDPTATSGTRLRLRYLEAGPGAYRTLDFFDRELGVPCAFDVATDGELRCLPRDVGGAYSLDASCAGETVMLTGETCDPPFGERGGRFYRRTTAERPITGSLIYGRERDGTCRAYFATPTNKAWLAEEITSARFVKGTSRSEPRAGMNVGVIAGEDGSTFLASAFDTARGTTCNFASSPGHCLPRRQSPLGSFSNATCTAPVASVGAGDPAPDLVFTTQRTAAGCVASTELFEPGPKVAAGATIYRLNASGVCEADPPRPDLAFYGRGASVPLSRFPVVRVRQEGTGAIRARRYVDANDAPLGQAFAFWDADHDRECQVARMPDQSYRCVATGAAFYEGTYYADPGCTTTPLGSFNICRSAPAPFILRPERSCAADLPAAANVYDLGPAPGAIYFGTNAGACTATTATANARFFTLGNALTPEQLPRLELKTE